MERERETERERERGLSTLTARSNQQLDLTLSLVVAEHHWTSARIRLHGLQRNTTAACAIAREARDAGNKVHMLGDSVGQTVCRRGAHNAATSELMLKDTKANTVDVRRRKVL